MTIRGVLFASVMTLTGALALPQPGAAQDKTVRMSMQSWFPGNLPHAGSTGKDIERKVAKATNNTVRIRFYEPGALVPPAECFDAVASGSLDACWSTPAYWHGKNPAFSIFSAVPFGPNWPELIAWFYKGGGKEIYDGLYNKANIQAMPCGGMIPEASGWFKKEIKSLDDMKGLKMRILGLGGAVLQKLGVSTQLLAGGDIYPALELGSIDATEFAAPSVDRVLGFHEVAKFYYFPGWHQPATFYDLMMNLDRWKALSETQRFQIEMVCGDNLRQVIAEGESIQGETLEFFKSKGVQIRRWPPEMLEQYRKAWHEVAADYSAKNETFKAAWSSQQKFRDNYKTWRELQDLGGMR
jgi:TRAP-type mannitol/chloroaromatic compound transport system substrate-binding protein